jgi:hypothetical protein
MPSDPRATLTIVASDPATQLDEILTRWDDEAYETALNHLESEIEEQLTWLESRVTDDESANLLTDTQTVRQALTEAVAAVRNADQKRTDNNQRAGAR